MALKNKTKSQRQGIGTIWTIAFFALGFLTYLLVPVVQGYLDRVLTGWKGLVILMGAAVVLEGWFLILGYRGKSLLYVLGILLFTILCIWLALNFNLVWDSMVNTIGLWPTIFITLFGCLGLWLVIKVLL